MVLVVRDVWWIMPRSFCLNILDLEMPMTKHYHNKEAKCHLPTLFPFLHVFFYDGMWSYHFCTTPLQKSLYVNRHNWHHACNTVEQHLVYIPGFKILLLLLLGRFANLIFVIAVAQECLWFRPIVRRLCIISEVAECEYLTWGFLWMKLYSRQASSAEYHLCLRAIVCQ